MVAAVLRGGRSQTGVRPFDPYHDVGAVADLIAVAYGDRLDPTGQVVLAEMRRVARWEASWWWLWPNWSGVRVAPGFVWAEEGRVVGNISLRRALEWRGFLIGNVAVHPDWRGRGIARALIEAALEEARARGGHWSGLEVEADNRAARQLYERLGFRKVGSMLHMLRPPGLPWVESPPLHPSLRRGHSSDRAGLIDLVRAIVPEPQRPLLELDRGNYQPGWERALDRWLGGRREAWWVVEEDGALCGAVRVLRERGRRPDQLEVLVSPEHDGRIERILARQGVASLRGAPKKMVEIILPATTEPLVVALEAVGFQELRVLVQMRLDLVQSASWG